MSTPVLRVVGLRVGEQEIDFKLSAGAAVALVGGADAQRAALSLLMLERCEARFLGFVGQGLQELSERRLRELRGGEMALLPATDQLALHPLYKLGAQLRDVIRAHRIVSAQAARDRAIDLLELAGLEQPDRLIDRYPQGLTGPQRARVGIALALANSPRLLVACDPFAGLEPTAQLQLLDLLSRLRAHLGFALVFATSNLAVAALVAESAIVLGDQPIVNSVPQLAGSAKAVVKYLGWPVETGPADLLTRSPRHPYTGALVSAHVLLGLRGYAPGAAERDPRRRIVLLGDAPADGPGAVGCPLQTRCPKARPRCREERPELTPHPAGTTLACHFPLTDEELLARLPIAQAHDSS
jgi:peptide/nickel transport system ATP-binding protein